MGSTMAKQQSKSRLKPNVVPSLGARRLGVTPCYVRPHVGNRWHGLLVQQKCPGAKSITFVSGVGAPLSQLRLSAPSYTLAM